MATGLSVDGDELFNEYPVCCFVSYLTEVGWHHRHSSRHEVGWLFSKCRNVKATFTTYWDCEFVRLSIPASNASGSVYWDSVLCNDLMNNLCWSDDRNRMRTELVKANCKLRRTSKCRAAFFDFVLTNSSLLSAARSEKKYNLKASRWLARLNLTFCISGTQLVRHQSLHFRYDVVTVNFAVALLCLFV